MAERLMRHLLLVTLLALAQGVMAWHSPSHILDHHDSGSALAAQYDCDLCVHGHALVGLPSAPPALALLPAAHAVTLPTTAPLARAFATAHPARGPPLF